MPGKQVTEAVQQKGSAIMSAAAIVVVVYGMQMAKVILVPFLIAVFLALITVRPMLWLQATRPGSSGNLIPPGKSSPVKTGTEIRKR